MKIQPIMEKEDKRSKKGFRRMLATRLGLTICLAFITFGSLGVGTYATFTATADTSSNNPTYVTCSMTISPIDANLATLVGDQNRLVVGATNLVPGDTIQRSVNVKNTGTGTCLDPTTPFKLTTKATGCVGTCASSLLNTDATNGLQMVIEKCPTPWVQTTSASTTAPFTYTCGGAITSVLASTPIIQTNATLNNLVGTSGTDNFLRVTLTFPSGAGNTFQNLTSRIEYSFAAQQRTATNK